MNMHLSRELSRKNAGARVDDHMEMKSVMDALKARDAEITAFASKATEEIKNLGAMSSETKSALEKLATSGAELQERLLSVEQKLARRTFGGGEVKSLGHQLTDSEEFKALQTRGAGTARMNLKASTITSATTDSAGSAGDLIVPQRQPGIIQPPVRELTIRDLLLPGTTSSNAIEFVQETGFTNAAAPVAEGATKPQSDLQFELKTTNVRTIAHWFAASKQVLSDVPLLMSYINTRAIFGLKLVEETQLLRGTGTGQNILGLIPQAADFMQSTLSKALDTKIDTIRRAILQVRLAEYKPTFVVLNPIDWADIETAKDADGRYIWVNVQIGGTMTMWRLAVIETTAVEPGEFLVGATMGAQVFDREESAVEVSTDHADFFIKNLVAIRAEERLALAVNRPECFVHGYFDIGASPSLNG